MPLVKKQAYLQLTADTNDILASHIAMQNAGPGVYRITPLAAAAADGTFTVNDGDSDIISLESIPVKAAAVTFPAMDKSADLSWTWVSNRSDRALINVVDGTNAEISVLVEKLD